MLISGLWPGRAVAGPGGGRSPRSGRPRGRRSPLSGMKLVVCVYN